jgi:hypothetical protein
MIRFALSATAVPTKPGTKDRANAVARSHGFQIVTPKPQKSLRLHLEFERNDRELALQSSVHMSARKAADANHDQGR